MFWSEDYAFDSADNGSVYVGEIAFDLQAIGTAFCIEMQWNEEPAAIPYAFFMDGGIAQSAGNWLNAWLSPANKRGGSGPEFGAHK